ncbi:hypothetical protein M422DRAFT_258768 [Sphaerobolus stellatus SS14]|uniref:F-box domain-containing protein n=1 Tax=Sphaerobolus stellatus (strain SS14) TaxID=990650 RepID=A0A0C9VLE5_SPHS4|nr:hypothetical protein M422DRAFT_258768 [Sphaerobolus stellatus SS14]
MSHLVRTTNSNPGSTCHLDRLPIETIHKLFEYSTSTVLTLDRYKGYNFRLNDSLQALVLSHVSSRWRSIAKSNTSLWKVIHPINIGLPKFCSQLVPTDLSVVLPLGSNTVCRCCSKANTARPQIVDAACRFIHENAHRISILFIIGTHPFLNIFLTTPFPILNTLVFLAEDPRVITIAPVLEKVRTSALFGGLAPNLRSVVWNCIYIPSLSGNPWRNLRSLQFSLTLGVHYPAEPSWRQLMLILSINSNLDDLTVVIPPFEEHLGPNSLTLSSLRTATFVVPKTQRFDPFFQSISIPNMEDIAIVSFDSSTTTTRMFSALGAQTKLISIFSGATVCGIGYAMPENTGKIVISYRNRPRCVMRWSLASAPEEASDIVKMLPAIKTLSMWPYPPRFIYLPPWLSVTVLDLRITEHYEDLLKWVNEDTFPSLKTILFAKKISNGLETLLVVLERLVSHLWKPEVVVSLDHGLTASEHDTFTSFCTKNEVPWRYAGPDDDE